MTLSSVQKLVASRAGRVTAWITVLFLGSVAARVLIYLSYTFLSQELFEPVDALLLALGLFAAWLCWVVYRTLIQPARTHGARSE